MSPKVIYIVLAVVILGGGAAMIFGGGQALPIERPLAEGVTQEQAAGYRSAARRSEFDKSKPGKYEWTDPGAPNP